ncbi:hypothetical protein J4429_01230 [Candidatus Pacearchaeota archaeon]|nr:hypothetical protein [Candidatus Pacearchaeota archaeon]
MKCEIKNHKTGEFTCERNIKGRIVKTNGKCEVVSEGKQGNISILGSGGGFGSNRGKIRCTDENDIKEAIRNKYLSEVIEFNY